MMAHFFREGGGEVLVIIQRKICPSEKKVPSFKQEERCTGPCVVLVSRREVRPISTY